MKKKKLFVIIILALLLIPAVILLFLLQAKPSFTYELNKENGTVTIHAQTSNIFAKDLYICIDDDPEGSENSDWQPYQNDTYDLQGANNFIHIKDSLDHIVDMNPDDHTIVKVEVDNDLYPFYPVGEKIALKYNISGLGDNSAAVSSSDENVASVEGDLITCHNPGTAIIHIGDETTYQELPVIVTDLYTLPDPDSDHKPFLTQTICTVEEAAMLDEVLERQINEAGYQTRAGVVAAARFLALRFPYKLAYFSESGRLDPASSSHVDGEGRYYHKGLYLSEDKYADIVASRFGPKYWGLFFREDTSDDHSKDEYYLSGGFVPADIGSNLYLSKRPNGLDCSGHVSWCYLNGGFDLGDIGAGGPGSHGMTQLGELVFIDDELLQSDKIKAGDLVGYASHIGIVIGVDEDHIWIADANTSGMKNTCFDRNVEAFEMGKDTWRYFILMDSEYLEDGNYTPMW